MKISMSRLKQIIKEETKAFNEAADKQEDRGSIMMALEAAGVPGRKFSDVQDALANAINKRLFTKEQGVAITVKQYKKYLDQARNELDPAVAGAPDAYVRKMMSVLAKHFNDKASGGGAEKPQATSSKEKPQATSSKPTAAHIKMKLDSLKRKFMAAKSKDRNTKADIPALKKIYAAYIKLGGRPEDLRVQR